MFLLFFLCYPLFFELVGEDTWISCSETGAGGRESGCGSVCCIERNSSDGSRWVRPLDLPT